MHNVLLGLNPGSGTSWLHGFKKVFNLSMPQIPHLSNGDDNGTDPTELC